MIQTTRITFLQEGTISDGKFVVYWMQQAQRVVYNHALAYARDRASELALPLTVVFCLVDDFPEANLRHYTFMLEGLLEVYKQLQHLEINMFLLHGPPLTTLPAVTEEAALLVTDCGYLHLQRTWRQEMCKKCRCPFVQVESDVIVPVATAYPKEAYSAAVLRPKLHAQLDYYLQPLRERPVPTIKSPTELPVTSLSVTDLSRLLSQLTIDRSVHPVKGVQGGTSQAIMLLEDFIATKLEHYDRDKNDPSLEGCSHLSPYLHFGQISPLHIALKVLESPPSPGRNVFLEELIVRRELSMNFAWYNPSYDSFDALPGWARESLDLHEHFREYTYSLHELETAATHDPYWNAAQRELLVSGRMHGYMRMYWGKKIIEWTASARKAFSHALFLNNKYALDGRDPNSFTGIAWCFGKHDRPWQERPVFGKVRYMNDRGLRRKFDINAYVEKIEKLRQDTTNS